MNIMPIAASVVRATARRVVDGAFPPSEHLDEWAIYQRDLEITRLMAQSACAETSERPKASASNGKSTTVAPRAC